MRRYGPGPPPGLCPRGGFCPKDHQQHLELAASYPKIRVGYTQIVTISTENILKTNEFRENWDAGDHTMHHPYQADHGRSPSAAAVP